jgi:D-apionolactonase
VRTLRAGAMSAILEPDGGLRRVSVGGLEILRRLHGAVRDRNWDTLAPRLERLEARDGIDVEFDAVCGPFAWHGTIRGDGRSLTYAMDGRATSGFARNRVGLCALHPPRAGACEVEHTDGSREASRFPERISPQQPFKNVRALIHAPAPGLRVRVDFEGDVFETEDHRNWTDASFKTYSTPLELPYPVEMAAGARVRQAVTVSIDGTASARLEPLALTPADRATRPFPSLAHRRVDLRPGESFAPADLPIELALHPATERDLADAAAVRAPLARVLVFPQGEKATPPRWVELARKHFRDVPVGGGTDAYFAELNRGPRPRGFDVVSWSINPQVHADDDLTLIENLEAQAWTVESARALAPEAALAVTPVTLRPRFNPNATDQPGWNGDPSDPRSRTPFGAAWATASYKYLAEAGAASVTYGALAPRLPDLRGWRVVPCASTDPLRLVGLGAEKDGRRRLWAISLAPEPLEIRDILLAPFEVREL